MRCDRVKTFQLIFQPMKFSTQLVDQIQSAIQSDRLVDTAVQLIAVPSPTRNARDVADRLAKILREDGFDVERLEADWPQSPAVVAHLRSGQAGQTLQFNGHLDTVHLPFVPPRVSGGKLYGSGASDMKGGLAAAIEAMRVLRDTEMLGGGEVLLTAADLHEAPWGDARQLRALIEAGYVGDGVLIPEYLADRLPVMGRGMAILEVRITRDGVPVHEVIGGLEEPRVITAGAELIERFEELDQQLSHLTHHLGDRESVFIGQVSSGEIYNQSPTEFTLSGTRRWLPGADVALVQQQFQEVLDAVGLRQGIVVNGQFNFLCDAFELDPGCSLLDKFQSAYQAATGQTLPLGSKPFGDDGNTFSSLTGVPAITHGPNGQGAHTVDEVVPVSELERVALVYALTAVCFCEG